MDKSVRLSDLLTNAGMHMRNHFKEQLIEHPGELGVGREEVIRKFLRSHLPSRFSISKGFVFDSSGDISEQMDIVIVDSTVSPKLQTEGGIQLFPAECVVAAGQVKSSMTSIPTLRDCLNNLESAKRLDRSAGGRAFSVIGTSVLDPRNNHLDQIFTFVFVIGRTLAPLTVRNALFEWVIEREPHLWPNVIFSLDNYLITYACEGGACPNPMHARALSLVRAAEVSDLLLRLYLLIGAATSVTRTSDVSYWEHLREVVNWGSHIYFKEPSFPSFDGIPYLSQQQIEDRWFDYDNDVEY